MQLNHPHYELKCSSTRSAQKDVTENWFRTPKASQRTHTLQSDSKVQTRRTPVQPFTSFKEEFQKVTSKMGSFVTTTSDFQMNQIYEQQVHEIKVLDLQNQNVSLQQENLVLKQQLELQKDQIKHKDLVAKKLHLTIQQLTSYNQQLKSTLDKKQSEMTDLSCLKKQIKLLENELEDKNNKIVQLSKIQDEIKSLEDFYVKMLNKMKNDLLFQRKELTKLFNHIQCLSQIAILNLQHEDLPIDLLFRYKQYGLFEEEEEVKLEVFEVTRDNGNLIAKIHEEIKKTFEKISYNLVEGFTLLNK